MRVRGYELTEADQDGFLDWRGNVAALRRARIAAGERDVPMLRTPQRYLKPSNEAPTAGWTRSTPNLAARRPATRNSPNA